MAEQKYRTEPARKVIPPQVFLSVTIPHVSVVTTFTQ